MKISVWKKSFQCKGSHLCPLNELKTHKKNIIIEKKEVCETRNACERLHFVGQEHAWMSSKSISIVAW